MIIDDVYDVIFVFLGLFFGQIMTHIFIYKVLHPYVVAPYLKQRKMKLNIHVGGKGGE